MSFQEGALFDSMSVAENVAFPLRRHTDWPDSKIREVARARRTATVPPAYTAYYTAQSGTSFAAPQVAGVGWRRSPSGAAP